MEHKAFLYSLSDEITRIEINLANFMQHWVEIWPNAALIHDDLDHQLRVIQESEKILVRHEQIEVRESELTRDMSDLATDLERLSLAELRLSCAVHPTTVNARVIAVQERISNHEAIYADYRSDVKVLDDTRNDLVNAENDLNRLNAEKINWQSQWNTIIRKLHLNNSVSLEIAQRTARRWASASGVLEAISLTKKRLITMDRKELTLLEMISNLPEELKSSLPEDPVVAAHIIGTRLEEAKTTSKIRRDLEQQVLALKPTHELYEKSARDSSEQIAELSRRADCEVGDLKTIVKNVENREKVREERQFTQTQILSAGDQLPIEKLREDLGDHNLTEIQTMIANLHMEESELDVEIETAVRVEQERFSILNNFDNDIGFNHAVSQKEAAANRLRDIVSNYLELNLARNLISEALQRIRKEQKNPLLLRAGELFSLATCRAFEGISTDLDDNGIPVVVVIRNGGHQVAISLLSEGTRDQLFLAFRLASVEDYCKKTEPLPFIADNLLVHFDDDRTEATMNLLAELGQTTQVLLFTHHKFVREAGRLLETQGRAKVIELN